MKYEKGVEASRPSHDPAVQQEEIERTAAKVTANGGPIEGQFPMTLEAFLIAQKLLPRSVVVEHNGEAVAPSEFAGRVLNEGDRLEIVKIVAGG